jgi:hypothetical protein
VPITPGLTGLGASSGLETFVNVSVSTGFGASGFTGVWITIQDLTKHVASIEVHDDSGLIATAFTQLASYAGAAFNLECWGTSIAGGLATTTGTFLKVNLDGGCIDAAATCSEWFGVAGLGVITQTNAASANPSIAQVMQDANNYLLAGFASNGATTPTAGTGTLDRTIASTGSNPIASSLVNNTAATAISVTDSLTLSARIWAAIGVELRSAVSTTHRGGLLTVGVG